MRCAARDVEQRAQKSTQLLATQLACWPLHGVASKMAQRTHSHPAVASAEHCPASTNLSSRRPQTCVTTGQHLLYSKLAHSRVSSRQAGPVVCNALAGEACWVPLESAQKGLDFCLRPSQGSASPHPWGRRQATWRCLTAKAEPRSAPDMASTELLHHGAAAPAQQQHT